MHDLPEVLLRCDWPTLAHLAGPSRQYPTSFTAGIYDPRKWGHMSFCAATILRTECPLWVKSGHSSVFTQCPLYPQKQTLELSREVFALIPRAGKTERGV